MIRLLRPVCLMVILALVLSFGMMLAPTAGQAATQAEIDDAIADGMAWLANQQNPDGSWGTSDQIGMTGLALVKFQDHAVREGISPFSSSYQHHTLVENAFDYLFTRAYTYDISAAQPHGDPDGDGDDVGVYFYGSSDHHRHYETGIALMAICSGKSPSRVVNVSGSPVDGWTYEEVAQDVVDYLAYAQADTGSAEGAWDYTSPNSSRGDQSVSGWVAHQMKLRVSAR